MSTRSHGGGGGAARGPRGSRLLPGSLLGMGEWGRGTPPARLCVACSAPCREPGGLGAELGVPSGARGAQLGAAPCPKGAPWPARTPPQPRCHFKDDLQLSHVALQKGSPCPLLPRCRGFRGFPGVRPGLGTGRAGCPALRPGEASARGEPVPPLPGAVPPRSPPGTLKVLKVKYYRLLCCCLTTTDKLRTSCQNVSAQQINIQNESQRYVVYN